MRTKKFLFAVVVIVAVIVAGKIGYDRGYRSNQTTVCGIKNVKEALVTTNGHIVVLCNNGKAYLLPDTKTYATQKKSFVIGKGIEKVSYGTAKTANK